ncbi:hypothetical protein [Thalassospira lucentensis]|uniref:hypothetical protein n=1 Tax=Thalassospira lucentensis TaxID=168935 RepID=UPI00399D584E
MKLRYGFKYKTSSRTFFSTTDPNGRLSHRIIVGASLRNEERCGQEPLRLQLAETGILFGSLVGFVIVLFQALFRGTLFSSNAVGISYRSIPIGKYAVSMALRHPGAYLNKWIYYRRLVKYLMVCVRNVDDFINIKGNVAACYVNETNYTNGVYCEMAAKFNIPLYHNTYPFRLSRFLFSENASSVDAFVVHPNLTNSPERKKIGRQVIERIVASTEKIEYMSTVEFESREDVAFEADAIVYAHSFTDAQQSYGGDIDFLSMYEWLLYTLNELKDRKVLLKAHPAFFRQGYSAQVIEWDRKVFEDLAEHISGNPNLMIIDWPMRNIDILRQVKKSCVLISHHGNALVEGASLGFRCISSASAPWKNYCLFNAWRTRKEYAGILRNFNELEATDLNDLYDYVFDLYEGAASFFHLDSWRHVVARETGIPAINISRSQDSLKSLSQDEINRLISVVSENICNVKLH